MELNDEDDIEKLKGLMETLNETVPNLISEIIGAISNTENRENLTKNTTKFYKELVNTGMEKEQAYELTREYLKGRDIGHLIREVLI